MVLAAHALGLGSCYIASFKECLLVPKYKDIKAALQIPDDYIPYFSLAVGYAAEAPGPRVPRKPDAVSYILG